MSVCLCRWLHLLWSFCFYEIVFFKQIFPSISPHIVVVFWSHAEQGPSVHHRKCGGEWARPNARLPQSRACWPHISPTPRPRSGLLWTALKTKKHLPCLNVTQTYRLWQGRTHTNTHLHIESHTDHIKHSHTQTCIYSSYCISNTEIQQHWTHISTHLNTQTLCIIISPFCCHWLTVFYKRQVKYNYGVNRGEKNRQLWLSNLPAAFFFFLLFLGGDIILISTNDRKASTDL